jgi:hypothetical protein
MPKEWVSMFRHEQTYLDTTIREGDNLVKKHFFRIVICTSIIILATGLNEASAQVWPNEPKGSMTIIDNALNCIVCNGWDMAWDSGNTTISTDSTAPVSPSNVLQFRYPIGFGSGNSPSIVYYPISSGRTDLFLGYAFKTSNPFQGKGGGGGVNKHIFIFPAQTNSTSTLIFTHMRGSGNAEALQYEVTVENDGVTCNGHVAGSNGDACGSRNFPANVGSGVVARGVWHKVELYIKMSTNATSRDGIIRFWVNGVLVGNYTTVNFGTTPWQDFQFSPTFGGGEGERKTQTDYLWFDNVHISVPGNEGVANLSPPPSPTGLLVH